MRDLTSNTLCHLSTPDIIGPSPFTSKVGEPALRGASVVGVYFLQGLTKDLTSGATVVISHNFSAEVTHMTCLSENPEPREGRWDRKQPGLRTAISSHPVMGPEQVQCWDTEADGAHPPVQDPAEEDGEADGSLQTWGSHYCPQKAWPVTHSCIWPRSTTLGPVPVRVAVPPMLAA